MVFPGRLSTGCLQCKRRKVKCDGAKPECNRCARYGRPCPGYGDSFAFRSQNKKLEQAGAAAAAVSASTAGRTSSFQMNKPSSQSPEFQSSNSIQVKKEDAGGGSVIAPQPPPPPPDFGGTVMIMSTTTSSPPQQKQQQQQQQQQQHRRRSTADISNRRRQRQLQKQQQQNTWAINTSYSPPHHQQQQQYSEPMDVTPTSATSLPSSSLTISRTLAPCTEQLSLCYFMSRYVLRGTPNAVFPGHLSFLFSLYQNEEEQQQPLSSPSSLVPSPSSLQQQHQQQKGPLELATLGAAQMTAYNKWRDPNMQRQAYENRGLAVKLLARSLSSRDVVLSDKTIGTVLLLCTFSDICGEKPTWLQTHSSGLYYLLEQRGKKQLDSIRGTELFLLGVIKLHINSFLTNDFSLVDPGGFSEVMQHMDPLSRARALVCKMPRLRRALKDHLDDVLGDDDPAGGKKKKKKMMGEEESLMFISESIELGQRCLQVLEQLDQWDRDVRGETKPKEEEGAGGSSSAASSSSSPCSAGRRGVGVGGGEEGEEVAARGGETKHRHYDVHTACTIILLRASRIMLSLSFLIYCQRLSDSNISITSHDDDSSSSSSSSPTTTAAEALSEAVNIEKLFSDIQTSVADIVLCTPYAVGDITESGEIGEAKQDAGAGLIILYPMLLLANCPFASPDQRYFGEMMLERMDKEMGIKAATYAREAFGGGMDFGFLG